MLSVPEPTQFDLRFRLLGIPVVVNPFFWVLSAFLGWQSHNGIGIVLWIGCVFVSIMVHEFGHALTGLAMANQRPRVVLYWMGGLCVPDREERSPWTKIAVLLMGPGAGFLLLGVVAAVGASVFGFIQIGDYAWYIHDAPRWNNPYLAQVYIERLFVNAVWGVFSLLPIFPLDGGQIAGVLLTMNNRHEGMRRAYMLSIGVAALVAAYFYSKNETYTALLVLMFGLMNFQLLQASRYEGKYAGQMDQEDDDWWKR